MNIRSYSVINQWKRVNRNKKRRRNWIWVLFPNVKQGVMRIIIAGLCDIVQSTSCVIIFQVVMNIKMLQKESHIINKVCLRNKKNQSFGISWFLILEFIINFSFCYFSNEIWQWFLCGQTLCYFTSVWILFANCESKYR